VGWQIPNVRFVRFLSIFVFLLFAHNSRSFSLSSDCIERLSRMAIEPDGVERKIRSSRCHCRFSSR
jgi:hypothetical protein